MGDEDRLGACRGTFSKPLGLDTGHLQDRWAERLTEAGSIEEVESWPDAWREYDNCPVASAPRIRDLVALVGREFARLGDLRFDQSNFGITTEGPDGALSLVSCKMSLEQEADSHAR